VLWLGVLGMNNWSLIDIHCPPVMFLGKFHVKVMK